MEWGMRGRKKLGWEDGEGLKKIRGKWTREGKNGRWEGRRMKEKRKDKREGRKEDRGGRRKDERGRRGMGIVV